MATFTFFHEFKKYIGDGTIDMDTDTWKLYLSNDAPVVGTDTTKTNVTEITSAGGYALKTPTGTWAETGAGTGVWRFSIGADQTWTASGAAFDTFRYVVLCTGNDELVGYWDAGTQNIADGSSFTVNVDADFAVFELS
jgi:hypothetical protein